MSVNNEKHTDGRALYDIFDHLNDYKGVERRSSGELMRRIDEQDRVLLQIRDMVVMHIETEKKAQEAVEELIILWRGSKIIIPMIIALIAMLGGSSIWLKEHIK